VKARDAKVRKVLTEAVPLKGYARLVWIAKTEQRKAQSWTEVCFNGPAVHLLKASSQPTTLPAEKKVRLDNRTTENAKGTPLSKPLSSG
jgi:hypothetical protein